MRRLRERLTSATTPVDVSEWTRKTTSAPDSSSRARDVLRLRRLAPLVAEVLHVGPYAAAILAQRSPNSPAVTASTRSPGERRFTTADSKAPEPDAVKRRTSFVVGRTSRSREAADHHLAEVRAAVVQHGLGAGREDLRRDRRRPGRHQVALPRHRPETTAASPYPPRR